MYFPFLRGKQFELLALRELAVLPLNGSKISPVIEPMKLDTKSIRTMLKAIPRDVSIHLIINPQYGEIEKGNMLIADLIQEHHLIGVSNLIPTYLILRDSDLEWIKQTNLTYKFNSSGYSLIHLNQISSLAQLIQYSSSTRCIHNIIPVNHIIALRRRFKKDSLVYLSDPFIRLPKNSDYINLPDEIFSNDYFFYLEESFKGFGDYLTIGLPYIEGGRLPYAVTIHLTYLDDERENIRIRHFVSDSNSDDSDTAGKFSEALAKLIIFINLKGINTIAAERFRDLHDRGAFPGLGSIKKLSIMHHIELVQSALKL